MGSIPFLGHNSRLVLLDDLDIHCLVRPCKKRIEIPEATILAVTEQMVADPVKGLVSGFDFALDLVA